MHKGITTELSHLKPVGGDTKTVLALNRFPFDCKGIIRTKKRDLVVFWLSLQKLSFTKQTQYKANNLHIHQVVPITLNFLDLLCAVFDATQLSCSLPPQNREERKKKKKQEKKASEIVLLPSFLLHSNFSLCKCVFTWSQNNISLVPFLTDFLTENTVLCILHLFTESMMQQTRQVCSHFKIKSLGM